MNPGHGGGISWSDFQAGARPSEKPSYFPETREIPQRIVRLDMRKRADVASVSIELMGKRDVYILEHAVDDAKASVWFQHLIAEAGDQQVKFWQQRSYFEGSTTLSCILKRCYMASSHRAAMMMMDENIIRRAALLDELQQLLPEAVRDQNDLFQRWPSVLQPARQCLIMGGTGGCSTLHTDMLAWTGWNALFIGRKHWKFFPPAPEVGVDLGAEVREMGGQFNLGFSCTSPVDMFHTVNGQKCPERAPDPRFSDSVTFGPDAERYPRAAKVHPLLEVIQMPGEVIIFPAHYFHQTYHYDPTIAIASQMLNEGCKDRVLGQILDFAGCSRASLPPSFWTSLPTSEQVRVVLGAALDRHMPGKGQLVLERMQLSDCGPDVVDVVSADAPLDEDGETAAMAAPLSLVAVRLACGILDIPPWEAKGSLPVAWALPLAQDT
eukprot:gnl/TRDRNA2_/TRDRNA2_149825_c0_seq1.p1 gnl/TRDRNA2_/TRDRNA2_149825_c0~~gnl/TRDRNA2_/TRDRNA2_149825_c0_seq1.p1  ORF type:complete len:437 (-),score=76.77 gnl/TRDRNA2_/TRDRNA2_149825_c0_seq1:101-1411(-)